MNVLTNALIALGSVGVVGYALMSHLQNRAPHPCARAGGDGGGSDSYSDTTNGGYSLGSWFSSGSSDSSTDSGSCSTSDGGGVEIAVAAAMVGEAGAAIRPRSGIILIQRNTLFLDPF